jgi:hypothetical protein
MVSDLVIIPSRDSEAYSELAEARVELSRHSTGTLFRKHILTKGDLIHPVTGKRIKIDDDFFNKVKTNFDNKVCPIVQVPLANDSNQHVEDPDRNVGEVIDVEVSGDKLYAVIDARRNADKFKDRTYIGASAMLSLDYVDTTTGSKAGPTLCHVAVTNRPYITNLEDYEEIVKASADNSDEAVLLTEPVTEETETNPGSKEEPEVEEHKTMTKEELIAALKAEHGIDVDALQTEAAKPADTDPAAELSNKLVDALAERGVLNLSNTDSANVEQVVGAVVELAKDNLELSNRIEKLELSSRETEASFAVKDKVRDGFIEPANEEAMVELYMTNKGLYEKLLPSEPIVNLSGKEIGTSVDADENKVEELDVEAEALRLSQLA